MYRKRLIASAVSIFVLGVVFGIFVFSDTFSFCAVLAVSVVFSVVFMAYSAQNNGRTVPKYATAIAFAVAVFSSGVLLVGFNNASIRCFSVYDNIKSSATLKIVEADRYSIDARIVSCSENVPKNTLIRFYADNAEDDNYIPGDLLDVELKYQHKPNLNLSSQDIMLTAYGTINEHREGNGLFYTVRKIVYSYSGELFGDFENAEEISKGVTIGDRSSMDSYLFSIYRSAGLSHILAISGLHISIIAISLYGFLKRLGAGLLYSGVASILVAVFYCALIGFNAAAVRAVIMLSFVLISRVFMYITDGFTTISLAVFVLLVINPYSIYSAGFQLSFLCCLGILLIEPYLIKLNFVFVNKQKRGHQMLYKFYSFLMALSAPIVISLVTSVFSFPVLCMRFDTVSYASPIVNLIAVPLFNYAVGISIIAYLVAPISDTVAKIIAFPAGVLYDFVTDIAQFVNDNDIGVMSTYVSLIFIPFLFSLIMIGGLVLLNKKRFVVFVSSFALFCISLFACNYMNSIIYNSLDVVEYGSYMSEYVYTTADDGVYVDMGGYSSYPSVVYQNGKTSLKYYVMTDYSDRSYKKLENMSGSLKVKKICIRTPRNESEVFTLSKIKELANDRNCDIILFKDDFHGLCSVSVFGCGYEINDGILVCADVDGKKIRILGDGFDNAVNCDVAIVTDRYIGDSGMIYSDDIYAENDYLSENNFIKCTGFNDRIRIEIDKDEREYTVYEP